MSPWIKFSLKFKNLLFALIWSDKYITFWEMILNQLFLYTADSCSRLDIERFLTVQDVF